jgi:hypothetical protein
LSKGEVTAVERYGEISDHIPPGVQRVLARLRDVAVAVFAADWQLICLAEPVSDLRAGNQRFADLWATGTVAAHREDHKTIEHPSVGQVTVDCDVLTDGDSDLKIVIMSAVPGSADETKLKLASITGAPDTTNGSPHAVGRTSNRPGTDNS